MTYLLYLQCPMNICVGDEIVHGRFIWGDTRKVQIMVSIPITIQIVSCVSKCVIWIQNVELSIVPENMSLGANLTEKVVCGGE